MSSTNSLKELDIFKLKKSMNMNRKRLYGEGEKQAPKVGSNQGGMLTLGFIIIVIWRFYILWNRMYTGQDDKYSSYVRANHMTDDEKEIDVKKANFLPSIELIKWESTPEIDLILRKNSIDIEELNTYVEPTIIIGHRNENFTDFPGNMKRIIYPMRQCKESDFTSTGYKVTSNFKNQKIIHRLCPDIPKDKENVVRNLY